MGWTKIDRSQWKREAYFRHYYEDVPCFYSMTVHLDITRLHAAKLRLQPAMLYLLARVINRHEEFRIALVDAQPGVYDVLFPSYTVFHPQTETFSNLWTEYRADFADFLARYDEDVLLYGNSEGFMPKPNAPENLFTVSTLPWARFESFHLHLPRGNDYLLPIFTIGRFFKQEGKILLPLARKYTTASATAFMPAGLCRKCSPCWTQRERRAHGAKQPPDHAWFSRLQKRRPAQFATARRRFSLASPGYPQKLAKRRSR